VTGTRFVAGAPNPAKWLHLAAAPAFAVMAVLTALDGGPLNRLCSAGYPAPLDGMAAMYLLMSMFHLPPWLTLICRPAARTIVA
jgi:hypothetical protein